MIQLVDISPPGQAEVMRDQTPMDVVHITAEMAPVAKVGGLGDVVQGLAKATAERGHNVQVHASLLPTAEHTVLYTRGHGHCML